VGDVPKMAFFFVETLVNAFLASIHIFSPLVNIRLAPMTAGITTHLLFYMR
jgi:hypothetical protein